MPAQVERMIDQFLAALRSHLLSHPGTFSEATKLTIDAYRKPNNNYDIELTGKTRQ